MKKYLLFASALLMGAITTQAQEKTCPVAFINLESGMNLSQFNFTETETAFTNGGYAPAQHQAIALGFDAGNSLNFILGAAYDKYTLIGKAIDMSSSLLSYDLNYVSASAGLELNLPLQDKISVVASGGMAYNYLFSGFQNMGAATYDLAATDFEEKSYSYNVGAALLYQVTDAIGLYLKYNWKNTIEMEENTNETYKLATYTLSTGIRFNLNNQ